MVFVVLNEKIHMPKNLVAHIRPRTSLTRLGLIISFQHMNAGYEGTLNIAIFNASPNTYLLYPNLRIGQVVFEELTDGITEDLVYRGVYQNELGTTGSKIYKDYIGKVVRHFKGNYYYVEAIGTDSETQEDMIIYRPLYARTDSMLWCRPAKMFFEEIDKNRKDNATHQTHRFEVVENLMTDYTRHS